VTKRGLEARDGTYFIARDRLWDDEDYHGWIPAMSEKGWVDLDDFAEALRLARHIHRAHCPQAVPTSSPRVMSSRETTSPVSGVS
jgi:hypothetical protein